MKKMELKHNELKTINVMVLLAISIWISFNIVFFSFIGTGSNWHHLFWCLILFVVLLVKYIKKMSRIQIGINILLLTISFMIYILGWLMITTFDQGVTNDDMLRIFFLGH